MVGKTVIVVAHRLSTVANLDRILVFERGRIIEDGNHDELLARRGLYHTLWSRQTGQLDTVNTDAISLTARGGSYEGSEQCNTPD